MLTVPRQTTTAPGSRPRLRVIEPDAAGNARRRPTRRALVATAAIVAGLSIFGVVVAHVAITQGQFELQQLREQSARAQAEYDRLRLDVAELESPERIVADAQQRLGMVTPPTITYLTPSDAAAPPSSGAAPEAKDSTSTSGWPTVKPVLADG